MQDDVDDCPLEGPADASLGQFLDSDGCIFQSQCSDGIDNNSGNVIDFDDDPSCTSIIDDTEDNADTDGDSVQDDVDICEGFDDSVDDDNDGVPFGCDADDTDDQVQ